jgi:hypothetical protein
LSSQVCPSLRKSAASLPQVCRKSAASLPLSSFFRAGYNQKSPIKLNNQFIMPKKNLFWLLVILAAAFIIAGDKLEFFPEEVQDASFKSREFVVGLWPDWLRPKDNNQRTEKAIEEVENQANP